MTINSGKALYNHTYRKPSGISHVYLRCNNQCKPNASTNSEAACARGMLMRYRNASETANKPSAQIDAYRTCCPRSNHQIATKAAAGMKTLDHLAATSMA